MIYQEIGTAEAILSSITTLKDGSVKVSFEVNPDNKTVINNLMTSFLAGKKLFTLGIVQGEFNSEISDG